MRSPRRQTGEAAARHGRARSAAEGAEVNTTAAEASWIVYRRLLPVLQTGWKSLRLAALPGRVQIERLQCPGLVKVNHRVELVAQAGHEIVTHSLGLRAVHDSDGPLQHRFGQLVANVRVVQREPERRQRAIVE